MKCDEVWAESPEEVLMSVSAYSNLIEVIITA